QLIVRRVVEYGLDGAAGDGLALLHQLQGAPYSPERQIEARGRTVRATGIQSHDPAADIDDRRPGGAAGGARGRLQIEGIEVVVLAEAVLGGLAIQPRERARQNGQLLAGIVADDP